MISRVSSNHTHDIHWPSTPEKEVNKKETPRESLQNGNRIDNRFKISILMKCYFMA